MRALRVLVPAVLAALLAVLGSVLSYVYVRENVGAHVPDWLNLVAGLRLQPFPGRILGNGLRALDVAAWLVGLVVLLVVLAGFLAAGGRTGRSSAFLAGWLGTVVGTALAGLAAGVVFLGRLFPEGRTYPAARTQFLTSAFSGGLYWGFFVGIVIGLVALLLGRRAPATAAPAPTPAAGPPER